MIAPARPPGSPPSDPPDSVRLEFQVDPEAQPGDVTAALARLLIARVRRRMEAEREAAAPGDGQGEEAAGPREDGP